MAAAIFIAKAAESLVVSHQQMIMIRIGLRIRSALIGAIYRKCLRLAGTSSSTGQIQNLMATDAQQFLQTAPMMNALFWAPVQLVVTLVWLAILIGPSFLAGLFVMIALAPLQAKLIFKLFRLRAKQQKIADDRVKLINEAVQGMRVVKLYAWEKALQAKIDAARKEELTVLKETRKSSAMFTVLLLSLSSFVTVVTFSVYALAGNSLQAKTVITAHSLLTLLRFPLAFLPFLCMRLIQFLVSLKRISRFFLNPGATLTPHHHITPHRTTSHHTTPHHTAPHHTTSHHTTSHHANHSTPLHSTTPLHLAASYSITLQYHPKKK